MHFCDSATSFSKWEIWTKKLVYKFISWWRLAYFSAQLKMQTTCFTFYMQNIQDYLTTFSLNCVITLTQSAFQIQTSVFKFLLAFIQLPESNKQLLDEVEHVIMNYQSRGMSLALADITQNPSSIIVLLYIIQTICITKYYSLSCQSLETLIGRRGLETRHSPKVSCTNYLDTKKIWLYQLRW